MLTIERPRYHGGAAWGGGCPWSGQGQIGPFQFQLWGHPGRCGDVPFGGRGWSCQGPCGNKEEEQEDKTTTEPEAKKEVIIIPQQKSYNFFRSRNQKIWTLQLKNSER